MHAMASVSYSVLLEEIQQRKLEKRIIEIDYCDSLIFDLHMAQKSLQRVVYAQQVGKRELCPVSQGWAMEMLTLSSK